MSFLRSAITILCVSTFAFVSCSKDKDDASNPIKRSDLVNKTWIGNGVDVKVDNKTHSLEGDSEISTITMLFKDNGEYAGIEDGEELSGKWSLTDNVLKLNIDGYEENINITSLDGKTLKLMVGEKLDISKNPADYMNLENEDFVAYLLGFTVLAEKKVDITKVNNKQMDVILVMKAK